VSVERDSAIGDAGATASPGRDTRSLPKKPLLRGGLLLLGLPQLAIGIWAVASPRGWFTTFPGLGQHWLHAYGAFDSHLAFDVGAGFVAVGVFMLLAATWLDRRLVQGALVAYLAYALPHYIFHLAHDHDLATGAQVANDVVLGLSVALALGLLALASRVPPDHAAARSDRADK
jgi:hypothetical protein